MAADQQHEGAYCARKNHEIGHIETGIDLVPGFIGGPRDIDRGARHQGNQNNENKAEPEKQAGLHLYGDIRPVVSRQGPAEKPVHSPPGKLESIDWIIIQQDW